MYTIVRLCILLILYFLTLNNIPIQSQDKNSHNVTTNQSSANQQKIPMQKIYTVKNELKPQNITGISQAQIDDHWKLYEGYVKQVNTLNQELAQLRHDGKGDSLAYADRRRRYGFEYNGLVLHEYYFENLGASQNKQPSISLLKAMEEQFGSFGKWQDDFKSARKTRGIGWAILCIDPLTKNIFNIFVADHEIGNIASYNIIIAMDVWEHAYMVDHRADGRGAYIDAFIKNINWDIVNKRYETIAS